MNAGATDGLLAVDLAQEVDVPAQKINQFAGAVDLRLKGVLALPQHGRAIHVGTILRSNKIGGFEKDGGAVFPA